MKGSWLHKQPINTVRATAEQFGTTEATAPHLTLLGLLGLHVPLDPVQLRLDLAEVLLELLALRRVYAARKEGRRPDGHQLHNGTAPEHQAGDTREHSWRLRLFSSHPAAAAAATDRSIEATVGAAVPPCSWQRRCTCWC